MTKPLEQSSDLQLHESFDYSQSERVDLTGTLETLGGDEPGKVKYLRESTDGQYSIYKYIVATGGNKGGIKNRYVSQVGPWVEGTQFTDANGDELEQDRFGKGDVVYLRVPKNKETSTTPGKVEYLGNRKDKENRNWKYYSYTFVEGGTTGGVRDRWVSQQSGQLGDQVYEGDFCDANGNKLKKEWFGKGETIYIRVPNTDIIDPTPDMTADDIMNLSDNDLENLYLELRSGTRNGRRGISIVTHEDKLGVYYIIKGKKVYWLDNIVGGTDEKNEYIVENKPFLVVRGEHGWPGGPAIIKKVGETYIGVDASDSIYNEMYRGEWERDPEDGYQFSYKIVGK